MKTLEMKDAIGADALGRARDGVYVARWGFFYRHGRTSDGYAARVARALPGATVVDHGEVWKPFRGGASVAASSHWFVKFTLPEGGPR